MKVAGLSIEGSKARASIVSKGLGAVKHLATDEITLPPEPDGRNAALKEALSKWKSAHGISGVVVGLGPRHFSHRTVELPVKSREDIKRALGFEMEKHLPLEPNQYSMDFHTIETSAAGTKNLVLAIRKEKLKWISDCLGETGLKLVGVKCTAIEAANELLSTVNVSDALLVYPEEEAYHLVGLRGGRLELLKTAKNRAEAASEVEHLLEGFGKTLYAAADKGAMGFERFNPRTLPLNMAAAVASSLAGKGRKIKADFVPEEFASARKDYYPYAIGILCAACVAIFFSTAVLAYIKDLRAVRWTERRTEELKASTRELVEMSKEAELNRDKTRFLHKFQNDKNRKIKVLAELSGLLPKEAWLTSLLVDEAGKIEVEGFAVRAADVIGPLEGSPLFKGVEFSSPVTVKEGIERFSLKMQLEGGDEY